MISLYYQRGASSEFRSDSCHPLSAQQGANREISHQTQPDTLCRNQHEDRLRIEIHLRLPCCSLFTASGKHPTFNRERLIQMAFSKMETLRKQLELKAVEIVDILEALDMDEKVPEVMRRRRGQDNFDQRMYIYMAFNTSSSIISRFIISI